MTKKRQFETEAIRNQMPRSGFGEHTSAMYVTSSFVFDDAEDMRASFAEEKEKNIYSRFSNPNNTEFVDKIVAMEGAESGYAFASGMAAIFSTFGALLSSGDHILSARSVFGSTHALFTKFLPKWNIETTYFNISEVDHIESLIQPNTKILFAETPTNPGVVVIDLDVLGARCK
jgi:O-succinylhomoserine sulfhydrylase